MGQESELLEFWKGMIWSWGYLKSLHSRVGSDWEPSPRFLSAHLSNRTRTIGGVFFKHIFLKGREGGKDPNFDLAGCLFLNRW